MVGWFICVIIERDFLDNFFFLILCFCFVLFHSKLEFPIDMCSTIFVCLGCFLTSSHLPLDSESFLEIVSIECFTCSLLPFLYIFSWISTTTKTYLFSFVFLLYLFLNFSNNKNLPILFCLPFDPQFPGCSFPLHCRKTLKKSFVY